jgi:hypothetical protein
MSRNNPFNIHARELIEEENKYSAQAYEQAITDEDLALQPLSLSTSPQSTQGEIPNLDVEFDEFGLEEKEEKWVGITDADLTLQPFSMPPSPQSTQGEIPNLDVEFDDFEFDIDNEEENDIAEAG